MALLKSEIVTHPSADMTQTSSAGGRMNWQQTIASGLVGYVVDDINLTEITNGATRHYKLFQKIGNIANLTARSSIIFLDFPLVGDVTSHLIKGNFTNTWANVSANRKYGCGNLKTGTSLTAGTQTLTVTTRSASYVHFQNGDLITITDLLNDSDATGHRESVTIDQAVSWSGNDATIHFSTPLKYSYADSRSLGGNTIKTRVASTMEYGDIVATATPQNKVSTNGTYNASALGVDHIATITQTFTFTFTSASAFTVTGDTLGTMPSGNISSTYSPNNSTFSRPYLTVPATFWTGTWATGNTIQIATNPCAAPYFIYLDIPAGTSPQTLETLYVMFSCNSGST
jgi:hypothetical protein